MSRERFKTISSRRENGHSVHIDFRNIIHHRNGHTPVLDQYKDYQKIGRSKTLRATESRLESELFQLDSKNINRKNSYSHTLMKDNRRKLGSKL